MFDLSELFIPLTANPAAASEFAPCRALRPYIRCFWGTADVQGSGPEPAPELSPSGGSGAELIIPDSCMDIIWQLDAVSGRSGAVFSGINDAPFETEAGSATGMHFGIRFHFWAVHLFADEHLREVLNVHTEVEQYFRSFHRELGDKLLAACSLAERIAAAEAYLLQRLERRSRSHDGMMNAVYSIVARKGVVSAKELADESGISGRQLERLFRELIGVAPKRAADLVRFQNVWRELYRSSRQTRDIQDIVYTYNFSHQSHLINNFKKYAGRTPGEALAFAHGGRERSLFCNTGSRDAGTL
ncbi:helix-turn-helix domain-containing protein [Paenibacillus tepidiphilus]|uniref:helix-turn-helix domain-containing protein n=1 Tax=Paenibacillus tepidiphilus TaxID=2608683 RepID=UPI00123ABC23|nr:helix-turn-helix domain-containing protein [Paenibacillus tepidiphilus]